MVNQYQFEYMERNRDIYEELKVKYLSDQRILQKRYNLVGILRFISIMALILLLVYFIKSKEPLFLILSVIPLSLFVILVRMHAGISRKKNLARTLTEINNDEVSCLKGMSNPFDDGAEYIDPRHQYSFDLDFFGPKSIFHNINRTASWIGKTKLSALLRSRLPNREIVLNQESVREMADKLDFRQKVQAYARMANDSKEVYLNLVEWIRTGDKRPSLIAHIFSYLFPVLLIIFLVMYIVNGQVTFRTLTFLMFLINLAVLSLNVKGIRKEISGSTRIDEIIRNYSLIISTIEDESFSSEKLRSLRNNLVSHKTSASREIKKLSSLFSQLDSLFNLLVASIANGIALYHLHVYRKLQKWKRENAGYLVAWLDIIGEVELIGSLAGFSYNYPSFAFPDLNDDGIIEFENLGHPLIPGDERIDNSVDFIRHKFIILTGSNMSGKSTFLRSLGVNMVLGGIGAPVCASKANINPLDVWVSMRVSDSLEDNESYFLAKVKRLKEIMDSLDRGTAFILLDEILRGTNSDDKHFGTVEVIKKLALKGATGVIATHDLKVCDITAQYPDQLINKCFEVEVINNELSYDYLLRDGVCRNKNATFLMRKTGVI